jgi:Zn-dependent peptidase ImmA (M78 family)
LTGLLLDKYPARVYYVLVKLSNRWEVIATMEETDLISAKEAAKLLGVSKQAIRAREESGSLIPAEVEWRGAQRRPKFRRSDVEALKPKTDPSQAIGRAAS